MMQYPELEVSYDDLSLEQFEALEVAGKEFGLAIDTETEGLKPGADRLEVVSVAVPDHVVVVALGPEAPPNLKRLLRNDELPKLFHHALFDLSFLWLEWRITPSRVYCTKVAARVAGLALNPTLEYLAASLLNVRLDKKERLSDWSSRPLSDKQVSYAAHDVRYLHELQRVLTLKLSDAGETELFDACMAFLPWRVRLGARGLDDVYAYSIDGR